MSIFGVPIDILTMRSLARSTETCLTYSFLTESDLFIHNVIIIIIIISIYILLFSGHIGITVDDTFKACERFERLGVEFVKKPNDGNFLLPDENSF